MTATVLLLQRAYARRRHSDDHAAQCGPERGLAGCVAAWRRGHFPAAWRRIPVCGAIDFLHGRRGAAVPVRHHAGKSEAAAAHRRNSGEAGR